MKDASEGCLTRPGKGWICRCSKISLTRHSKLDLEKLTQANTIEEFVNSLKGTEYYSPLSKIGEEYTPLLFDYGMALDQYYFANIWSVKDKLFKKENLQEIIKAYGNKFDMLNLQWIYRSRRYYHMAPADIYALLIPVHYKLSHKEITALVEAADNEEFRRVLDTTAYKKRYPELAPGEPGRILHSESQEHPGIRSKKISALSYYDLFLFLSQGTRSRPAHHCHRVYPLRTVPG